MVKLTPLKQIFILPFLKPSNFSIHEASSFEIYLLSNHPILIVLAVSKRGRIANEIELKLKQRRSSALYHLRHNLTENGRGSSKPQVKK